VRPGILLASTFALAFGCRVGGQLLLGAYAHPETWEYEAIATNILAGRGYTYTLLGAEYVASQSSPLYIYLAVVVYALSAHSQAALLLVQALLGAGAATLCAWLGLRLFSARVGWLSGLLAATHPALIVYAAKLHALTLDVFLVCALVAAFVAVPRRPASTRLGLLGALLGLAALTRTTVLVLLPAGLLWLRRYRDLRPLGAGACALVVAALVVFLPWSIRDSLLLGQPVLLSSESAEWFWRGNNPNASGSSWTADGRTMLEVADPAFRAEILAADEARRMTLYRAAALEFWRADPGAAVRLYVAKLAAFWWMSPSTGLLYPAWWVSAYMAYYLVVAASALVGVVVGLADARARSGVVLIVLLLALVSLGQSLFYVEGRHRWEVEPLLLVLAAAGAVWAWDRWRATSSARPAPTSTSPDSPAGARSSIGPRVPPGTPAT
jgi:4-amino-4-deoxy-L-arabinose transferase-like glycosyltransferase